MYFCQQRYSKWVGWVWYSSVCICSCYYEKVESKEWLYMDIHQHPLKKFNRFVFFACLYVLFTFCYLTISMIVKQYLWQVEMLANSPNGTACKVCWTVWNRIWCKCVNIPAFLPVTKIHLIINLGLLIANDFHYHRLYSNADIFFQMNLCYLWWYRFCVKMSDWNRRWLVFYGKFVSTVQCIDSNKHSGGFEISLGFTNNLYWFESNCCNNAMTIDTVHWGVTLYERTIGEDICRIIYAASFAVLPKCSQAYFDIVAYL